MQSLFFTAPRAVEWRTSEAPQPRNGELRVRTALSAISSGTELLIYRGDAPQQLSADETISALGGGLQFPLKYGYACVGEIEAIGADVDASWLGRRVFAFNPHETHFVARVSDVHVIPDDVAYEDAAFLPNMETAVNFLLDGAPLIGEVVAVVGQGVVGLLTTMLLAQMPLSKLITLDRLESRRARSLQYGADVSLDPSAIQQNNLVECADLCYELSSKPAALDTAIELTRFSGRIVIGSWYGNARANVDLGGRFHRSRIQLISSQVSTLTPTLHTRWDKTRRFEVAWQMIRALKPSQLITHRLPFEQAAAAYSALDQQPDQTLQALLRY